VAAACEEAQRAIRSELRALWMIELVESFSEERSRHSIPLQPAAEMHACGEMVGLCAVTSSVSQNEVVTKVNRIS
jgi:hypothetical protein